MLILRMMSALRRLTVLGIDRLTMLLCGLSIKDAEFLFRGPNRLTP